MEITFPGGARVDAHFGSFVIKTDQSPLGGGEGSAPSPFATFLASLGTCAGIYVLSFLKQRGLPTDGVRIIQKTHSNPATGLIEQFDLEIQVPENFPEKYKEAMVRSAELCAVKKHFEDPPRFRVYTESVALAVN
ncbi:MAG: OsmC family protein [Chloroflexota bacterium]|nr:OsmC family protein [Chloroflexota bacterium]